MQVAGAAFGGKGTRRTRKKKRAGKAVKGGREDQGKEEEEFEEWDDDFKMEAEAHSKLDQTPRDSPREDGALLEGEGRMNEDDNPLMKLNQPDMTNEEAEDMYNQLVAKANIDIEVCMRPPFCLFVCLFVCTRAGADFVWGE